MQIGAPSRTHIRRYHDLMDEVKAEAERINRRFQTERLEAHRVPGASITAIDEILPYYRAADVCLVTSLHDGMNLVAKEYVAAQDAETGRADPEPLRGASHELVDALVVNPYDTEAAGRRDPPRAGDVSRGAPRADEPDARLCSRTQYLSLGRQT